MIVSTWKKWKRSEWKDFFFHFYPKSWEMAKVHKKYNGSEIVTKPETDIGR